MQKCSHWYETGAGAGTGTGTPLFSIVPVPSPVLVPFAVRAVCMSHCPYYVILYYNRSLGFPPGVSFYHVFSPIDTKKPAVFSRYIIVSDDLRSRDSGGDLSLSLRINGRSFEKNFHNDANNN